MRLDMDRPPLRWRGDLASAPTSRPEEADLERLKPRCEAWQCETPVAPLRQEEDGVAAAGIETAKVSC